MGVKSKKCAHQDCKKQPLYAWSKATGKANSAPNTPRLEWRTSSARGTPTKDALRALTTALMMAESRSNRGTAATRHSSGSSVDAAVCLPGTGRKKGAVLHNTPHSGILGSSKKRGRQTSATPSVAVPAKEEGAKSWRKTAKVPLGNPFVRGKRGGSWSSPPFLSRQAGYGAVKAEVKVSNQPGGTREI